MAIPVRSETLDLEQLARELVRHWRGERTQLQASVDLGLSSNVFSSWERGAAWPSASRALTAAMQAGRPVQRLVALARGDWGEDTPVQSPDGVALFLNAILGREPVGEIAARAGLSRHALSRYLNARAQPSLLSLLSIARATRRLRPLIEILADPEQLPSLAELWAEHRRTTEVYANSPLCGDVHLMLYLEAYHRLPQHQPGWIAERLSLSLEEEQGALDSLVLAGIVEWTGTHYRCIPVDVLVDVSDVDRQRRLHEDWHRRQLWVGEQQHYTSRVALMSRTELKRLERILNQTREQVNEVLHNTDEVEEMVYLTLSLRRLTEPG